MQQEEIKALLDKELLRVVERYRRTYKDYKIEYRTEVYKEEVKKPEPFEQVKEYKQEPLEQDDTKVEILDVVVANSPENENKKSPGRALRARSKPLKPREKKITDENGRKWTSDKVKLKAEFMRYQYERYKKQCEEIGKKPDYHREFMKLVTDVYKTLRDDEKVENDTLQWV